MPRSQAEYLAGELFHLVLIVAAYSSPWWVDWRIITVGAILLWAQFLLFGGCLLNKHQYGDIKQTVYERYLVRMGFRPNRQIVLVLVRFVLPLSVVVIAYLVQH